MTDVGIYIYILCTREYTNIHHAFKTTSMYFLSCIGRVCFSVHNNCHFWLIILFALKFRTKINYKIKSISTSYGWYFRTRNCTSPVVGAPSQCKVTLLIITKYKRTYTYIVYYIILLYIIIYKQMDSSYVYINIYTVGATPFALLTNPHRLTMFPWEFSPPQRKSRPF